jgi:peptide/nickel transport system substrate-binding protein
MTPQKKVRLIMTIALAVVFLLPACISQAATELPEPTGTAAATPVPAKKVLNIWNRESPTILNPYLSSGIKDLEPSRIPYEPLASYNGDGELIPVLALEIPSLENDGLAADGKSVIWKLRQDVFWSDGEPFTADDVKFTYDYIIDPEVKAAVSSEYSQVTLVEALDDFTIKITFKDVNPAWSLPFVGIRGVILPRHIFASYKGANAREAPANTLPVGTGPYRVKEPGIKPQEVILLGLQVVKTTKTVFEPNPYFRFQDKLAFKQVIWHGGGATDVARKQLLEEGVLDVMYEFPFESLELLGDGSKAKLVSVFPPGVHQIFINQSDPFTLSADGEFSNKEIPNRLFDDKVVRQAFAHAMNRDALAALYGALGKPAYATLIDPPQFRSSGEFYKYDLAEANKLLDDAGYVDTDGDGIREKGGKPMKVIFTIVTTPIALKGQEIIQKDLKSIGIDVAPKQVDSSIAFGDPTNPDHAFRFNADMLMFRQRSLSRDPTAYMKNWTCARIPQKADNWTAGSNYPRWCNPEYDALLEQTSVVLDPVKRQEMFIKLNDMLIEDVAMIPLVWSASAFGVNVNLTGFAPTPWDSFTWNIQDWRFTQP